MKILSVLLALPVSATVFLAPCAAQTNKAASVSLKTECFLVRTGDVDTSHLNFTSLSPPRPSAQPVPQDEERLEYAAGYLVVLLRQQLLQHPSQVFGVEAHFLPPVVSAQNNVPVTLVFSETVPDPLAPDVTFAAPSTLPHIQRLLQLEGSLTLTPHINPNKTITLDFSLPPEAAASSPAKNQVSPLPPVQSGTPLLIRNSFPPVNGAALSLALLLRSRWTLLIFVTPSLIAGSNSTKKPPGHLTGRLF